MKLYRNIEDSYSLGETMISVCDAGVVYNQHRSFFKRQSFEALQKISFDIYSGESIGIIGRNGAGKSTLLLLLAGIIKPDRGQVINFGFQVSLLALQAGFLNELSGIDNIFLSGMALGFTKTQIQKKIDEIVEFSGIRSHIHVPVRTYSTGMRARLGFSIAHMLKPDILLIDETLGVGDKDFRKKSSQVMKEKIQSNQTVVMVSHNSNMVKELCNRVVWIERGVVVKEGRPEDIVTQYEQGITK